MTAVFKSDEKQENTLRRHYETEAEKVFYESFFARRFRRMGSLSKRWSSSYS